MPNIRRQDVGPRRGRDEYNDNDDNSNDISEVVSALASVCYMLCHRVSPRRVFQKYLGTTRNMGPTHLRVNLSNSTGFLNTLFHIFCKTYGEMKFYIQCILQVTYFVLNYCF